MIFSHKNKNEKGNIMFTTYKYRLSVVAAVLVASTLSAGQVGALTNFQADTTAKASEVNHNFIVLKDAVNDNDTRISVKQDRIDGACGLHMYMQSVNTDGSVICQPDIDTNSGGDITGVTAGYGLTGGGSTGAVTINTDTNVLQKRVTTSCPEDSSIRVINADGSVVCEIDNDSTFTTDIGIDYSESTNSFTIPENGSAYSVRTLIMTVPMPGHIHLTAQGTYYIEHSGGVPTSNMNAGITTTGKATTITTTDAGTSYVYLAIVPSLPSGDYYTHFSTSRTIYVSTGGTYYYYFRVSGISTGTDVQELQYPSLTAIFVPNRY